jgi:hypothetical protein
MEDRLSMTDRRILELALEALNARRTAVEAEIQELTAALKGGISRVTTSVSRAAKKRRPKSRAERKAQSIRMKQIWEKRRTKGAEIIRHEKTIPEAPKRRPKTAAEKRALSQKMKLVWARKRAEAAKKGK